MKKEKIKEFLLGLWFTFLFFTMPIICGIIAEVLSNFKIEKIVYYLCIFISIFFIVKIFKD